ncbi:Crp/Fnr family transcriptional regulator [Bradyrhizobium sp. 164]|uniref:Crp/Fnr family transcriptional regulator n=1 Tax=Bradyrhizobium sp. 164 TaxID=2782637 RepID=UPI001FF9B5C0|nr:Crp/Fnr family transcriptional regulator [Bradyrhizobium sp. 164]MCK1598484.1 Crp/Fnr family transcriptional regulator [Bradyrhizobium sp. 164]
MQAGFAFSKLADRLASLTDLTAQDLEQLADMPSAIAHVGAHQAVLRRHDETDSCCLVLQGYLAWYLAEGQQGQITSIHVPGDIPDLHTLYQPHAEGNLVALGSAVVALVPHSFFHELSARSAAMSRALLLMQLTDLAIQRDWTLNLGSRNALARVAHLICEITERLQAVGLARDLSLASPFTQSDLAAACGISPVHANRTVQELRRRNLLRWHGKIMTIVDLPGLVRLAGFDPAYLRTRPLADRPPSQCEPVSTAVAVA